MADTLMTQTLPTVVGAGVVSRTTDTMFGRRVGGGGRGSKRKQVVLRKVGGRVVHKGKRGGKYVIRKGRKVYV